MKKLLIFLLAALTAFGAAGCGKEKGDFGRYESVAGRPADAVFSFESGLGEEKPPYPLSDGRTFYISAEGTRRTTASARANRSTLPPSTARLSRAA